MTAPVERLERRSPMGIRWAWLVEKAQPYLDGTDPWLLYRVDLSTGRVPSSLPAGPAVYGALGVDAWQYCGQTLQPLRARLNGHARDNDRARQAAKAARWVAVAALSLVDDVPAREIARLERAGKDYLRPRMGSRWPRPQV